MDVRDTIYVGGAWVPSTGTENIDVVNPTTEEVVGRIPQGTPGDVDKAVAAAREAFAEWSETSVDDRSKYLQRIYVDSLVHDARALRLVLDTFGADRVALGSDYPFPLGEERPGALIESMNLAPEVRDRLRAGTALEWLGREASSYDL